MKRIFVLFALIISVFLVSCGKDNEVIKDSDYSPESKKEALMATEALSDTMVYTTSENPIDDYFEFYVGDPALLEGIEEYVYFTSAGTAVAEAGIFKVKDQATADALLEAFDTRKEALITIYENYSPEDVEKASNMKKGSFDDVVWFVASSDNAAVEKIITK